ncbi:DNA cytosine methyltransferase [Aliarcobacter cryaerophilus]|uniref:DNA cytosine methyltransferase n=1 Tax=Aliarcobacter cryaerophilus TaxID=28198 RepID=UPI0011E0558A|nr:DNA cytosine methyltransferase [Aliarcobacter cryaerophilus]
MTKEYYKFDKSILLALQEFEQELFLKDFNSKKSENFINISYSDLNYSCKDKIDKIIDSKIQAISFFSGAGGLDIGAQLAGVKIISSLDFNKDAVNTMKLNSYFNHTKHFCDDISNKTAKDYADIIKQNKPEKLILIGGPPCQPFSKAGYWVTNQNRMAHEDPRNMIGQYLRIIKEFKPDGFVLENVESILHPSNIQAVHFIEKTIQEMGYNYKILKLNSADFGVPQKRKRVFFVASHKKFEKNIQATHGENGLLNGNLLPYENVLNWIGRFDDKKYFEPLEECNGKYYNDLCQVKPGKNYIAITEKNNYPNPKFIAGKRYWSFLLKLHPNLPSWTIIAKPGHWEGPFHWNNRRLRNIEAAAIQTFPYDYKFYGSPRVVRQQIGNAVPPLLGKAVVEYLLNNL